MSRVYKKHEFVPKNPQKYTGTYPIISRSSWEWDMMRLFDELSTVLSWASEPFPIPYRDPVTGNQKVYIPDFYVVFLENNEPVAKLIEIKPLKEAVTLAAKGREDAALVARNNAKWEAAMQWCVRHGAKFEVMDESRVFSGAPLSKGGTPIPSWTPSVIRQAKNIQIKPRVAKAPKQAKTKGGIPKVGKVSKVRRVPSISRIKRI